MAQTKSKTGLWWVLIPALLVAAQPVFAEDNVQDLKKQVAELQAKVAQLEANQNAVFPELKPPAAMGRDQWDPFSEMEQMHNEMEQMFHQAFSQPFSPRQGMFSNQLFFDSSQMEETKEGYLIKLNIGGFDKDKIAIDVNEHSISISGEYKGDENRQDKNAVFESHNYGRFLNTLPLPEDADTSKMKTEKKGDHLEIYLPKRG